MRPDILMAQFVTPYIAAIRKYAAGAGSKNGVAALHHLRTNIRRLRNTVKFFSVYFPAKKVKQWDKKLKKVTEAASSARDKDVYLDFLRKYKKGLRSLPQKKAVERLIRAVSKRREKMQPKIREALSRLGKERVIDGISTVSKKPAAQSGKKDILRLYKLCRKSMTKRVRALLAFEPVVRQPSKVDELHKMRIAAKHVRYSLEGIKGLYGGALDGFLGDVLAVHKQLGEFHDYDVWAGYVTGYLAQKGVRPEDRVALVRLKKYIRMKRGKSHKAFVGLWSRIRRKRTLEGLVELLREYK